MKSYLCFSLLLCIGSLYAQKTVVADSVSKKPILLKEVVVKRETKKSIKLGYFKKRRWGFNFSKNYIAWGLRLDAKKEFILTMIPEEKYRNRKIEKLCIPLWGPLFNKKTDTLKNKRAFFRVNIYEYQNGLPGNKVYASNPIVQNMVKYNETYLDISGQNIHWNAEGLCFGIEFIGCIDEKNKVSKENSFLSLLFAYSPTIGFSAKTFYKEYSLAKPAYIPYTGPFAEELGIKDGIIYNPNLRLGIIISKE